MPKESKKNVQSGLVNKFWYAIECGTLGTVRQMVQQGAPVNHIYKEAGHLRHGQTPLSIAVSKNSCALVRLLVSVGANLEYADSQGETPLFIAIRKGKLLTINELLRLGSDINHVNNVGETPLFTAIRLGRKDLSELLISKGANINIVNYDGSTPLLLTLELFENCYTHLHATRKSAPLNVTDISRVLIPLCDDLNYQHPNYGSALRICLNIEALYSPRDLNLTKYLLQHGARPDYLFFLRYGGLVAFKSVPEAEFFTEKLFNMSILAGTNLNKERIWLVTVLMEMPDELSPYQPLFSSLKHKASNPLNLQDICCIRLRHLLHGQLWKKIDVLPLPIAVKNCLKLT